MIRRLAVGRSSVWILLVVAALWMSLSGAACGGDCPPIEHDDVIPLDLSPDAGAKPDAATDGAVGADASADSHAPADATSDGAADGAAPDSGRPDAGPPPDGGAPIRLNCAALAEGCTPGQACPPACNCVLARSSDLLSPKVVIEQCILLAGAGPPSVEVRSHLIVDCE